MSEMPARLWWTSTTKAIIPAPITTMITTTSSPTIVQLRQAMTNPTTPQLQGRWTIVNITDVEADRTLLVPTTTATDAHRSLSVRQVHTQQMTAARIRSTHATPGVPNSLQRRNTSSAENAEQAWDRRQGNAMYLLVSGVTDTTATTYCTGWKHWLAMCREYDNMDPFLQTAPRFADRTPMQIQIPFQITVVLHFLAYLAERGSGNTRQLKATTILNYLTAIRHFLQINLVDVSFMESPIISKVKLAIATEERFDDLV